MSANKLLIKETAMSEAALTRLRGPKRRGRFAPVDAAKAELALLTVADDGGQARIYYLVDIKTSIIEDARFLAFGHLASHPICDVWMEDSRGKSVQVACETTAKDLDKLLADDDSGAFGEAGLDPYGFISDLQSKALAELPNLQVLPKPVEVPRYERKRKQDWDEKDQAWLPLTLMQKITQIQTLGDTIIKDRLGKQVAWKQEGLHDDFELVISFTAADQLLAEEKATVLRFLEEGLRGTIHPRISVAEYQS